MARTKGWKPAPLTTTGAAARRSLPTWVRKPVSTTKRASVALISARKPGTTNDELKAEDEDEEAYLRGGGQDAVSDTRDEDEEGEDGNESTGANDEADEKAEVEAEGEDAEAGAEDGAEAEDK